MTSQVLAHGKNLRSPGGSFFYEVQGPCCQLYDREELPWPCSSLAWRGKQPSWNRVGKRFVPDLAASRCPSYSVVAHDAWGNQWQQVLTLYHDRLEGSLRKSWYAKVPAGHPYPFFSFPEK
jgi:hypothetical protein